MAINSLRLHGSSLCGSVTYEVPDAFEYSLVCHCSNCRRVTGAASKPFAGIASSLIAVLGDDHVMRYGDEAGHDLHCQRCGSLLYSLVRNGTYVHVALGTLIDSPSIRPTAHIFVGSKSALGHDLRRPASVRWISSRLMLVLAASRGERTSAIGQDPKTYFGSLLEPDAARLTAVGPANGDVPAA